MCEKRLTALRVDLTEDRRAIERSNAFELAYNSALGGEHWPGDVPPRLAPLSFSGFLEGKIARRLAQEAN